MSEPDRSEGESLERVPCTDELCTGTLNARGVCNYCGKAGPVPAGAVAEARPEPAAEPPAEEAVAEEARAFDPEERVPCVDDLCTGTLNERGLCNYCGKRGR